LATQLNDVYKQVGVIHDLEDSVKNQTIEERFTRLDVLTRIGNTVFALDLDHHGNLLGTLLRYVIHTNASWFNWVQYNGSIQRPMTRNAGEALGVFATLNYPAVSGQRVTSSAQINIIFQLEQLLAGDTPPTVEHRFTGLVSPKWPDKVLPPINPDLASKGATLYRSYCKGCHLPATYDPDFWTVPQWLSPNALGERYLNLNMIDIARVDTDPAQAEDMKNRSVVIPIGPGITTVSGHDVTGVDFGNALRQLVA
jgi:hypothetical protein